MGHLEKHDALSPLSPPRQKYLENVKKVKKTTKSAIFMKICNTLFSLAFAEFEIQDLTF